MKKLLLFLFVSIMLSTGVKSQAVVNWPGGRWALSADGNQHDKDDIGATPFAMALMYYAGLADRVVHIDYSNHLGDNNTYMDNMMIESVNGGVQRFGVDANEVFNCQTQLSQAINNFKNEALKCSASDPLWYICAGPMEVAWRCLNAVKNADPTKLQYIHCVSHGLWNEVHSDTPELAHTWDDMKTDFTAVTFHEIVDQNTSDGEKDFQTEPIVWAWLQNSPDADQRWLYTRNVVGSGKFDVSDAGMTYWTISGGPNGGDQRGGVPESKDLFENPRFGDQSITGVELFPVTTDIYLGNTLAMDAQVAPSYASNKNIFWSSSNTAVATIDAAGIITSKALGTTTITVTTEDGGFQDQSTITVVEMPTGWLEGFSDLPDGAAQDNGVTAWSSTGGSVLNGEFQIGSTGTKTWTSQNISTTGASSIDISIDVAGIPEVGSDGMESADYIKTFYQLDGGNWVEFSSNTSQFSWKSVGISGLAANSVAVKVEVKTSAGDEYYYFDNVHVVFDGNTNSIPTITTSTLPDATVGLSYSQAIQSTGGESPLTWTIASGSLPAGLSLSASGTISGTPTSKGSATFSAQVADVDGDSDSKQLSINVLDALNVAPVVSLSAPVDGESIAIGNDIIITAMASDEDGSVNLVEFFSNGSKIGDDATSPFTMSINSPAIGDYAIFAVAIDNEGATNSSPEVNVTVYDPNSTTVEHVFNVVDDAYLENGALKNNSYLKVEANRRVSYLKFNLSGILGSSVESAVLQLAQSGDDGNGEVFVYEGSHSNWTEANLSTANAPLQKSLLGSVTSSYSGSNMYEFPLTGISGDGDITLVLSMTGGNDPWFSSSEGSVSPKLVVTTRGTSESTYQLNVVGGSGDGMYTEGETINVSANSASTCQEFSHWSGNTEYLQNISSSSTIVTMPAMDISITAVYSDLQSFTLNVLNGTAENAVCPQGYISGDQVYITADAPSDGYVFAGWTGDISFLDDPSIATPELVFPSANVTIEATYTQESCSPPAIPAICLVTVDGNIGRNVVTWDNSGLADLTTVRVYKESEQAGTYEFIGSSDYTLGSFTDSNADPEVQSSLYKIASVNACGDESSMSAMHKTIHLSINKGVSNNWNLIWTPYHGVDVKTYNIYRGSSPGDLVFLVSVASTNTSYTDKTAPAGDVYYQVEALNPNTCGTKKSITTTGSLSNIASVDKVTGILSKNQLDIRMYPNPSNSSVYFTGAHQIDQVSISTITGQVVMKITIDQPNGHIILDNMAQGVYLVHFCKDKRVKSSVKLIKH